ncbi:MAG: hypothetical protein ACYTG6_07240 [Planctomycetota bacterium]
MRCGAPRSLILALLVLGIPTPARAEDGPVEVETAHYHLYAETSPAEAEEMGRVLEAAWTGFRAHFDAKPDLARDDKLVVRFAATREGWDRAIRADGATPPARGGGYYWPASRTAYLYRQPTRYFTRVLLVHEACHQFHYLARTGNRNPTANWYTEGIAEYLSWHTWDGEVLTLGVLPAVSLKDYAASAFGTVAGDAFDLEAFVEGEAVAERALCWSLFRYLATGKDGEPISGFRRFCRRMDRGARPLPVFQRAFGRVADVRKRYVAWLEREQQPWAQVFNQWEGVGEGRMRGMAGVVSVCRLKADAASLATCLEPPDEGPWKAGLLLHYVDPADYTVALVRPDGTLRVDRRRDGRWERVAAVVGLEAEADGTWRLRARRDDEGVCLDVGTRTFGPWALPGRAFGLALDDCEMWFSHLAWE